MSAGYKLLAGGGRVTGSCEYEGNMARVNAIGKYAWVVSILGSCIFYLSPRPPPRCVVYIKTLSISQTLRRGRYGDLLKMRWKELR